MPDDELRGGTETGCVPPFSPNDQGGTGGSRNAGNANGTTHDAGGRTAAGRGTRTDARDDAEEMLGDGSRHQSAGTAKQFARDEADVDTTAGSPDGGQQRHHDIHPQEKPGGATAGRPPRGPDKRD